MSRSVEGGEDRADRLARRLDTMKRLTVIAQPLSTTASKLATTDPLSFTAVGQRAAVGGAGSTVVSSDRPVMAKTRIRRGSAIT